MLPFLVSIKTVLESPCMQTLPDIESDPAIRMETLQALILEFQEEIEELESNKRDVRLNMSLNAKQQTILNLGAEIEIVKLHRKISKAKAMLSTQKMKFLKESFWNTI